MMLSKQGKSVISTYKVLSARSNTTVTITTKPYPQRLNLQQIIVPSAREFMKNNGFNHQSSLSLTHTHAKTGITLDITTN